MRILFLDDSQDRINIFTSMCDKHDTSLLTIVTDVDSCISTLKTLDYDFIFLDHDLGRGKNGMHIVKWIVDHKPPAKVIVVHSSNWPAAQVMASRLNKAGYTVYTNSFSGLDFQHVIDKIVKDHG